MIKFRSLNELRKLVSNITLASLGLQQGNPEGHDLLEPAQTIAERLKFLKQLSEQVISDEQLYNLLRDYGQSLERLLQSNDDLRKLAGGGTSVLLAGDDSDYKQSSHQLFVQIEITNGLGERIQSKIKQLLLLTTSDYQTPSDHRSPVDSHQMSISHQFVLLAAATNMLLPPEIKRLLRPRNWKPDRLETSVEEVAHRTQQAIEKYGAVDQRVDDLTDQADSESDPQKAIHLLHKALRYSTTRTSESRIYLSLGMKYEDTGELAKAIESYSKSMEITEPFALGLYYRGLVYLKLRQSNNARIDIMKALEFQPETGLDSYDRGQATKLLHEIDNNNQIS